MKQLLVIGETILAAGYFFDDADELRVYRDPEMTECDAIYPHHVMEGYGIAEADVPDGFRPADYLWRGEVVEKPPVIDPAIHNAEIDAQIVALEEKITQRRIREALISGDHSFIYDIESKIAVLRTQKL